MKKLLIALATLSLLTSYALAEITVKAGLDFPGTHKAENTIIGKVENDSETGFSLTGEYSSFVKEKIAVGGGLSVQFERKIKDTAAKFNFIPVYALGKYFIDPSKKLSPYLIGQLGYNFFLANDAYKSGSSLSGGLYYGIGVGVLCNEKKVLAELLYSVNQGTADTSGLETDIKYSKLSLSFGYQF